MSGMTKSTIKIFLILVLCMTYAPFAYSQNFSSEKFESFIKDQNQSKYKSEILEFYESINFKPAWHTEEGTLNTNLDDISDAIYEQSYLNGLSPEDYNMNYVVSDIETAQNSHDIYTHEYEATRTIMNYINDIKTGRITLKDYDPMAFTLSEGVDLSAEMAELVKSWRPKTFIADLAPSYPEYIQLRDRLAQYREIDKNGGWPKIDIARNTILHPGEAHEAVAQIKARLDADPQKYDGKLSEDVWTDKSRMPVEEISDRIHHISMAKDQKDEKTTIDKPGLTYDADLALRIAEFQYLNGMRADTLIGPKTIEALAQPVENHIQKIKLALERWRWLPEDLGRKNIQVNIAAQNVKAVNDNEVQITMPVVVGQKEHQTPIFSSIIKNVKIHPDWVSTDNIAERYVIPKIQENPAVVSHLGYQVQDKQTGEIIPWDQINVEYLHKINLNDYQFRQKPGQKNALGLARFSIENDYAIFMHGTPKMNLFHKPDRTFSSGCIRLESPLAMAHFLLGDQGMTYEELEDLYYLDKGETAETKYIKLSQNIPVHLTYMTAWIDEGENLNLSNDVYERDKKLSRALNLSRSVSTGL